MHTADHIAALVIAIVLPVLGYFGFRRMLARARRGMPVDRMSMYRRTIITNWLMTGILVWLWAQGERSAEQLGLVGASRGGFYVAAILCMAGVTLLLMQLRAVMRASTDSLQRIAGGLGRLRLIVPHTQSELRLFFVVAVTAGVVEEILWRGFLFWYLEQSLSPAATAVLITAGFGIAHAYQGWRNVPKITLVGAVFTVLYLISGSLWPSIFLHAAVDIIQGQTAYTVLRQRTDGPAESA